MQRGNVEVGTAYHPCSVMTCAAVVTPADAGTESVTPVMRIEQTSIRGTTTIGPTTWRYLDKLGRTIRAEAQSFDGPARVRRDTRYDARGRVRRASQPYYSGGTAHYTAYAYDARGRVLSETRPDGGVTTMAYVVDSANANQIRATATEEVYKPGSSTAAATRETVSLYNVMGELVSRTEGHGTADAAKTGIAYNGAGQPTTHTADGSVAATFDYDSAGFRESVTSPNFGTVTSTYTKFGELHARADGKGTTTWTYDTLGRPTKRKDPGGVAEWRYDPMYADGALKQRCYEQGANAARCADLSAPDFKQELAYGPKARLSTSTTTIEERGGTSYHHAYNYDKHGRIDTIDYPSELTVRHGYNERGYRDTLTNAATGATLEERAAMDAHGNVTEVTYGNGVTTTRAFDPKTGRARDIDTVARGGTKIQDNAYVWRSDGLLESRASHIGGNNAKLETFAYDPLGRLATATTKLGDVTRRTLSQTYDDKGNLKTKTSSVGADIGTTVSAYHYDDAAKPNRLSRATIGGKDHTFSHDADGNIKKYDCTSPTCGDDKYIEWNGRNLPHRITVGGSRADDTPTSRDEFAYGPDGARFHRETTYTDANDDLQTEHTYYVGSFEELLPRSGAAHASIEQTRVTDAVRHVRTTTVTTDDDGDDGRRGQRDGEGTGRLRRVPAQGPPGLGGGGDGRGRGADADAGARPVRGAAQGGLDGGADGRGARRAGGVLGSAHARAHGPRAPGPDGIHPQGRAGLRPDAGPVPEPGPAGGQSGLGAGVERLQLRLQQPDELRRPERAVPGARGWGLRLGRRDVRRGRGRLRPGERRLHAPLLVRGHIHLLRFLLVQPAHRALDQLSRRGRRRRRRVGLLRFPRCLLLRHRHLLSHLPGDEPSGGGRRSRHHAQAHGIIERVR